jgi:hypothetical protein
MARAPPWCALRASMAARSLSEKSGYFIMPPGVAEGVTRDQ